MNTINIRRPHGMTPKKARQAAERVAHELSEQFSFVYEWEGNILHFKRTGAVGRITVHKKDIELYVELNFLLGLMKSKIEREVHHYCDENFGPSATT